MKHLVIAIFSLTLISCSTTHTTKSCCDKEKIETDCKK